MRPTSQPLSALSRLEIMIGRGLAACCHPVAAWRVSRRTRAGIVFGYFGAGYVLAIAVLAAFG